MTTQRVFPTNPLIQEVLGEDHPIPLGWQVFIQTFDSGDNFIVSGEESVFEKPDSSKNRDVYTIGVGRVLMMGDASLKASQYKDWDFKYEVGDYVWFRKYEGTYVTYLGADDKPVNLQIFRDFEPLFVLPNPKKAGCHQFIGK